MIFAVVLLILLGLLILAAGIVWTIYTISNIIHDGFIMLDILAFICSLFLFTLALSAWYIATAVL